MSTPVTVCIDVKLYKKVFFKETQSLLNVDDDDKNPEAAVEKTVAEGSNDAVTGYVP